MSNWMIRKQSSSTTNSVEKLKATEFNELCEELNGFKTTKV